MRKHFTRSWVFSRCDSWRFNLAVFACLAGLGGCAAGGNERTAAAGQPDEVICERQYTTGSNIPKMICMTREEREAGLQGVDEVRNALNRAARTKGLGSTGQ